MAAQDSGAGGTDGRHRTAAQWFRPRPGDRSAQGRRPWRGEGTGGGGRPDPARPGGGAAGGPRVWWLWILLPAGDWVISAVMLSPEPRAVVSYTFFLDQVGATNVGTVTSTGETIEGSLKNPVSYTPPEGGNAEQVARFTTERPTFAQDDLFQRLQSTGVPVNAKPPDAGAPVWQQLLFGCGPTLLLL